MKDVIQNWRVPSLTKESSNSNQVSTVIRKIESEKGKKCDINPNEVFKILKMNNSKITSQEVNDILIDVL